MFPNSLCPRKYGRWPYLHKLILCARNTYECTQRLSYSTWQPSNISQTFPYFPPKSQTMNPSFPQDVYRVVSTARPSKPVIIWWNNNTIFLYSVQHESESVISCNNLLFSYSSWFVKIVRSRLNLIRKRKAIISPVHLSVCHDSIQGDFFNVRYLG